MATAAGYYSDSTEVTTAGLKKPADLTAVLKLIKIPPPPPIDTPPVLAKPEPPIALHNIYWDFDKAVVRTPDAVMTLDTITRALLAHKEWLVEVASHTDALGSNPYNDQLSDRRTKAAIEYLAKFGVTATQLVPAHFGEDAPVEPNNINGKDNPTGRQRNRRTEFHIIGKPTTTATPPIKTGQQSVELDAKKK